MTTTTLYEIKLIATTDAAKEAGKRDLNHHIEGCVRSARAGGYSLNITIDEEGTKNHGVYPIMR